MAPIPVVTKTPVEYQPLVRALTTARRLSRVRLGMITTRDHAHALQTVKQIALENRCSLYHMTAASRRRFDPATSRWELLGGDTHGDPLPLLQAALDVREGGLVILEDWAQCLRDEGGDRRAKALMASVLCDDYKNSAGLLVVMLESPDAHSYPSDKIEPQVVKLEIAYPRTRDLQTLASEELAQAATRAGVPAPSPANIRSAAALLAPALAGLTRSAARDSLRDTLDTPHVDLAETLKLLQVAKCKHLREELAMEVLDTEHVELPVGQEYLLEFLDANKATMRIYGENRSRGVLLLGPPGTGKTMLARAIGNRMGLPVVLFKISALMNSLLGETERKFAQAFATLESLAPCIVFIDEIEKAFGESSERDGGTMTRCTGALLSWLSDNRNPNYVIGTANNLKRMGEMGMTLTRPERFDSIFYVDVPTHAARLQMLNAWLVPALANGGSEVVVNSGTLAQEIANETDRFTGADLRSAVKLATKKCEMDGRGFVEVLHDEIRKKRPRAHAVYAEFATLRDWAALHCEPAGPSDSSATNGGRA